MRFKMLLILYLFALLLMVIVPLGGLNKTLTDTFVFKLRLDYLAHVLVFMPFVVLWRQGFPRHSLWIIMGIGVVLAVGLEGLQYLLSYRVWNMKDAAGNVFGAGIGVWGLGVGIRAKGFCGVERKL